VQGFHEGKQEGAEEQQLLGGLLLC
jgi:hypothetical protein